ncbi:MAG: BadF/BadG/BcrA/BcrD ATPase family protein [Limnochordia bacterium]|jgi:N-acetylglucosamine kinase-like BadF-type ATPase|nr:hypothetical protein [Limnochordia bacterium]MDD2630278.1 BadF/BadG/BcrA/BcrD ATPase family protein [Limnochordia bacterium]
MRYIAAFDGGGTSTICIIADETGHILSVFRGEGIIPIYHPEGPAKCRKAILTSLDAALAQADLSRANVDLAALGMTGGCPLMEETVRSVLGFIPQVVFVHDSVTAHEGALIGQPGIIVIAGTGAIAYGRGKQGGTAIAGGWGPLMGDEGSAYWIGRQALSLATQAEDGRGPSTKIREILLEQFACKSLWDMHRVLYSEAEPRPMIASLAPIVSAAASLGDQRAIDLLAQVARHLASSVLAVSADLGEDDLMCSYVGGVFKAGKWVLEPFEREIRERMPKMRVIPPVLSGDGGAVLLGLRGLGVQVESSIAESIRRQLEDF